jgi:hypothetical protein
MNLAAEHGHGPKQRPKAIPTRIAMPNAFNFLLCALQLLGVTTRMPPFAYPFSDRKFQPLPIASYPAAHGSLTGPKVMRYIAHVLSFVEPQ